MIILFVFSGRLYGFRYDYDQIILVFYEKQGYQSHYLK